MRQSAVVCDGRFPLFQIYVPLDDGARFPANGSADDAGKRSLALRQGEVGAGDLPAGHLSGKQGSADRVESDDQKPAGIPVQAVDAVEDKRLPFLGKKQGQAVCQSVCVVAGGRMDGNTGRFVDDQKIFILIDHGKIHRGRRDHGCVLRPGQADRETVSLLQQIVCKDGSPVYQDTVVSAFQPGHNMAGVALGPQKTADAHSRAGNVDSIVQFLSHGIHINKKAGGCQCADGCLVRAPFKDFGSGES